MALTETRPALAGSRAVARVDRGTEIIVPELMDYLSPSTALTNMPVPLVARRITWMVVSLVIACVLAAALVPIDKVVTGPGQVISLSPTIVMQPFDASIVRQVAVVEHQHVKKGDLLATLDPTLTQADLDQYRAQVRGYGDQVARDQAELDGRL